MTPPSRWLRFLPVTLVMAGLFVLSHQAGDSFDLPQVDHVDKILHLLAYTVLGLAAIYALPPGRLAERPLATGAGIILFCLGYGITDEFHQSFIPGRFAGGWDLVADAAGGLVAVIASRWLFPWLADLRTRFPARS